MGMGRGLDRQLMEKLTSNFSLEGVLWGDFMNPLHIHWPSWPMNMQRVNVKTNNFIRPSHLPLQGRAASGSVSKAQGRESWILTYRNRGVYFLSAT